VTFQRKLESLVAYVLCTGCKCGVQHCGAVVDLPISLYVHATTAGNYGGLRINFVGSHML
jgi:hypothetical protein